MMNLCFTGSNGQNGRKAEIRQTCDSDYRSDETGFSVFTWTDKGEGVLLWREAHGLEWSEAFDRAFQWLEN